MIFFPEQETPVGNPSAHFDTMMRYLKEGNTKGFYDYLWTYSLTIQSIGEALINRGYCTGEEFNELIIPVLEYIEEKKKGNYGMSIVQNY